MSARENDDDWSGATEVFTDATLPPGFTVLLMREGDVQQIVWAGLFCALVIPGVAKPRFSGMVLNPADVDRLKESWLNMGKRVHDERGAAPAAGGLH